ncbi:hypothetical protein [uncultured Bradyrhizobium sp.]|uniref:hypothetical protein n=1 Tax=uncultured Bradyrhizobium sp. TaxID=199684 RepID=UPI0035CB86B1
MSKTYSSKIDLNTGVVVDELHESNGRLHRDRGLGPARTRRNPKTGLVAREYFYVDGRLHRDDGPAMIEYFIDGRVATEAWYRLGMLHRNETDGPALVERAVTGVVVLEAYYFSDELYRDPKKGPCEIHRRDDTGKVISENYSEIFEGPTSPNPGVSSTAEAPAGPR